MIASFGGVASVRMRGASQDKTLVLVDGAPINDAAEPNGAYDFSSFELADIDRIESTSTQAGGGADVHRRRAVGFHEWRTMVSAFLRKLPHSGQ